MIESQILPIVIADQKETFFNKEKGVKRNIDFDKLLRNDRIIVITGIRRSGKSTLLRQIADKIKPFYYVNFDDERLFNFELSDFQELMLNFRKTGDADTIFIDEVQNVANWERFVRRIHDEGFKIFVTGSNARLLSSELATHLTGRYKKIELFPFSFTEYLDWFKLDIKNAGTINTARVLKAFDDYLSQGGFPEYIKYRDMEDLQSTYNDIIYKDLIARFSIKNQKAFKNLAAYLFTNFTKEMSYNSLKSVSGINNSNIIKDYIDYLQQAYLLFECFKYDYSLKRQNTYNKKVYVIDNGLRNSIAFKVSSDLGQLLENLIFIELKRRNKEVYFYRSKENYEVDFVIHENPVKLIQVCYSLSDDQTYKREIRALTSAMKDLNVKGGTVITYNETGNITEAGTTIEIIPAWKFLSQSSG